jgi:hypothetical protein
MLKQAIENNWKSDISGNIQDIAALKATGYPAWTVKFDEAYGVAIPYYNGEEINETFANARIRSSVITTEDNTQKSVLILTTEVESIRKPFAALCEALVDPGDNGSIREQIVSSPVNWWKDWKELLGNRNIDARIYDTLGELCALKYAVLNGEDAFWNGPDGSSYDIETESRFLEVKSTVVRTKRQITVSSQFQLYPHKPLYIVFCEFEPTILTGLSIDSIINEFEQIGYNVDSLNAKLEMKGFEKGMSSRKKTFIMHEMLLYKVDESFPKITPESFVGGVMPHGIVDVSYVADLSDLPSTNIKNGDCDDI